MRSLRIAINALYLIPGQVGGTEIYLRSLLPALAELRDDHQYFVYTNREAGGGLTPDSARFFEVPTGVPARLRPLRILYEQIVLPRLMKRQGIDVVFNPGFTGPMNWPRSVTVFHDLQHKRHPEYFLRSHLPAWEYLLGAAARRSKLLVAVSGATAKDLLRFYPGTKGRAVVIPHGVDPEFSGIALRRAQGASTERTILTVSTLHPHKNIEALVKAFAEFLKIQPGYRLVVAGLHGFAADAATQSQLKHSLEGSVEFTGWIPREDLYKLFEKADACIFPSLFEGFGMPLAEALAAGIPTACSDIEPFRDIAGGTALLFRPDEGAEIVTALQTITADNGFRERARVEGPAQVRRFDWSETARLTRDAIERAAD